MNTIGKYLESQGYKVVAGINGDKIRHEIPEPAEGLDHT
jgi:hypothetical protein